MVTRNSMPEDATRLAKRIAKSVNIWTITIFAIADKLRDVVKVYRVNPIEAGDESEPPITA
jgi:hypothetical protein